MIAVQLGLLPAALALVAAAAAAPPAPPAEIAVVASPADFARVRDLVPGHWSRLDALDPAQIAGQAGDRPRCWVDLSDPRRARLYFVAPSRAGVLVRDVALSGALDELDRRSLAEVLELSLAALRAPPELPEPRAPSEPPPAPPASLPPPTQSPQLHAPPPPAPSPPPTPASRALAGLTPGLFYAGRVDGGGLPLAHGPGLSIGWAQGDADTAASSAAAPFAWTAWLEGQARLPGHARAGAVGVGLAGFALRAGLGARWGRAARRYLEVRAGAGADLLRLSPEAGASPAAPPPALSPARWSESLVLTGALVLGAAAGRRAGVELRAFADVLPVDVRYDLVVDGRVTPAFTPWRVRPGLALAVTLR